MPSSNPDDIDELFSEPDDHDDTHHHHSETSNDFPSPWLDNPEPKSELYPDLTARLKCFTNRRRKMNKGEGKWPYRLYPPDPTKILFFEFRGYGPPPKDVGNPGDIYVDLTPSPGPNLCIYLHNKETWVRNYWNPDPNVTEFPLHWHPLLNDRYLWGTEASGFMWFTGDKLRQEGCHRVLEDHDPSSMIAAALKYDFCGDPWIVEMTEDNLSRKKEEEARRTRRRRRWLTEVNNAPLSPEQLREREECRERRRKPDEESRKKLEDRHRQRVHRRSLKGEPSSAVTRAALEQYRRNGLPVPSRRTRKRKRRGSDASGGHSSSCDENEGESCYIPRSMLKRKRGPTPGEDTAQPVPQRRQRSRTAPEAEKPSTSKPPQKERSRTCLPSASNSEPVASSSRLPPTTPTRHVHTPPITSMYLKPMTPVRLLSSSPMVFMASREDESENDDADSSHAPTCPDMDGSQLGEDFDIELKEREREVEDHWSSRHVSEVDDDHGRHKLEGERYQLLMDGAPQPIVEADAEAKTGAMGEDTAHQESLMAEAEPQTEITEDVSTDGDDERIGVGVEVEHVEKALLQHENNAKYAENEEEDEVDGRSQEAQVMTQNTDRGPSLEEQKDDAYDEDASTMEMSIAQEEYVDSPLDVEDERIRETRERVPQQEEEKDEMGMEMEDMQRHISEGESHWNQRDAHETDEEPEESVGMALDPSHGTNSLVFRHRSQSTEAEEGDQKDDVLEEDSHGDNGRQQVIMEDQETRTMSSHDAEETDMEVEEPLLVEQAADLDHSTSLEPELTVGDEGAQVGLPPLPLPTTEVDVVPTHKEDFNSVLRKAKDVHDFLSSWNPDVVRERDTLRARVADLSTALEKEKAAHRATQLHLGLARSAARASDDTIRQKSHQANALRQSLASQMELAENQRQEADAQRERAENCVRSLGDVTRQRDELSASLIEAQQIITRLSANLTEEQEHLERAQVLIREKDAKINGALQVAEKLHKTLFGLGRPEGEDNGRIQHP